MKDVVAEVHKKLNAYEDDSFCSSDVFDVLKDAREATFKAHGLDTRGMDLAPCDETIRYYTTAVQQMAGV